LEALGPNEGAPPANRVIRGQILDLGTGGLCLLTAENVELAVPLLCRIIGPGMPVGIPTLLQVRWADQPDNDRLYRLGLQFMV
jgi:hypothetical protein